MASLHPSRFREGSALASVQQPQVETPHRKPRRPQQSPTIASVITEGSRRWFRQWCETINTWSPKSLHGHRKYHGCHWDRKKYNWALRVHNVWVKCTAHRHLFLCGTHILSGVWTCTKSEQNHMCWYRTTSCFIKGDPRKTSQAPHTRRPSQPLHCFTPAPEGSWLSEDVALFIYLL